MRSSRLSRAEACECEATSARRDFGHSFLTSADCRLLAQVTTTRLRPGGCRQHRFDIGWRRDANRAGAKGIFKLIDADDVAVQRSERGAVRNEPTDGPRSAIGIGRDDGLPEEVWCPDAMTGEEVVVGRVAVNDAPIDLDACYIAITLSHFFGTDPDALIEASHLRNDVRHQVGAADVGGVVVHVVGGHQVTPVIARTHTGIGSTGCLACASAGQFSIQIKA